MNGNTRTKLNLGSQHENTSHLLKVQMKNLEVEEKNQHKYVNVNVIWLLLALVLTFEISFPIVHQGHIWCSTSCANAELHKFSVETQTFMLRKWANKKISQFTEAWLRDDWRVFNTFPFMQNKICFTSKAKRSLHYQGGMDFNRADIFSWWVMTLCRGCTVPDSNFQLSSSRL